MNDQLPDDKQDNPDAQHQEPIAASGQINGLKDLLTDPVSETIDVVQTGTTIPEAVADVLKSMDEEEENTLADISVGEPDEVTGHPIKYIVYSTQQFNVTIDSELSLNWITASGFTFAQDFGEVVGSCELSEALVDRIFSSRKDIFAYKKMLGSVIGRILDDKNSVSARKQLAIVDERINEHGRERVRMAYIFSSLSMVLAVGILLALNIIFADIVRRYYQDVSQYQMMVSILLGGIGSFITTFARFNNYKGSLVAGISIHRVDGFLRIFYGLIAGLIIFLAVKANVLIGFANDSGENLPWLFYFLALVAGASEVLIPNLIRQSEGELGIKKLEKKEQEIKDKEEGKTEQEAQQ